MPLDPPPPPPPESSSENDLVPGTFLGPPPTPATAPQAHRLEFSSAEMELRSSIEPATRADLPGVGGAPKKIDQYELGRRIGKGGMGVVYLARQESLQRDVAIKIIKTGRTAEPEDLERFRREAKLAASLHHPNIVQVFDIGEKDYFAYLVMEYIEGGSLHHYLAHRPMDILEAVLMLEQIARGVHYAHQKGIVHRDLKPGNILLVHEEKPRLDVVAPNHSQSESTNITRIFPVTDPPEASTITSPALKVVPKITDFGLAKILDSASQSGPITATGIAMGTPSYMSPEQARGDGKQIGPHSDIYALGAILYEMLTGKPPFSGDNAQQTMKQVCSDKPVPPSRIRPTVPSEVERICLRCLEKQPRRRYASAEIVANELRAFIDRESITEKLHLSLAQWTKLLPRRGWLLIFGVVTVFTLAGYLVLQSWQELQQERARTTANTWQIKGQIHELEKEKWLTRIEQARLIFERGYRFCEEGHFREGSKEIEQAGDLLHQVLAKIKDEPRALAMLEAVELNQVAWSNHNTTLQNRADLEIRDPLAMAYSPQGTFLATLSSEGTLELWDLSDRVIPKPVRLAEKRLWKDRGRMAWSLDGNHLAVVTPQGVGIWDIKGEKQIDLGPSGIDSLKMQDVVFHPDHQQLFFASLDGKIHHFKLEAGKLTCGTRRFPFLPVTG